MIRLERLRSYNPDPNEFPRQLKQLEDNAFDAVKKIDEAFLPVFAVRRYEASAQVKVGEFAVANTVSAAIILTFPAPSVLNAGRPIAVLKTSAANAATVAVNEGTVSGAASEAVPTDGRLYIYVSDGAGWWRTD